MKARLIGWHFDIGIEMPDKHATHEIRLPATPGECGVPVNYLDAYPTDIVMVARVFHCTGQLHHTTKVNAGFRHTIAKGAGATHWYEEDGMCEFDPETGEQLTCPCPTCKEGWTTPGQEIEK